MSARRRSSSSAVSIVSRRTWPNAPVERWLRTAPPLRSRLADRPGLRKTCSLQLRSPQPCHRVLRRRARPPPIAPSSRFASEDRARADALQFSLINRPISAASAATRAFPMDSATVLMPCNARATFAVSLLVCVHHTVDGGAGKAACRGIAQDRSAAELFSEIGIDRQPLHLGLGILEVEPQESTMMRRQTDPGVLRGYPPPPLRGDMPVLRYPPDQGFLLVRRTGQRPVPRRAHRMFPALIRAERPSA